MRGENTNGNTKLESVIVCKHCGTEQFFVTDTRPVEGAIRRRRQCASCNNRITTYEISAKDYEKLISYINRKRELMNIIAEI